MLRILISAEAYRRLKKKSQYNSSCFNTYLKQIRAVGVNPVVIPSRWRIDKLDSILEMKNY